MPNFMPERIQHSRQGPLDKVSSIKLANVRILTIFRNWERLESRVVDRRGKSIFIPTSLSEGPFVLSDSKNLSGKTRDPQQTNIG